MEAAVLEEWVEQCQKGHTRAFARIVQAMQQRILGFLFRMTQNREWAEEIGQEAFLRAFQKIHDYDRSKGTFSTWLFRIARNLCIDQMRKRKGRYSSLDDVLVYKLVSKFPQKLNCIRKIKFHPSKRRREDRLSFQLLY